MKLHQLFEGSSEVPHKRTQASFKDGTYKLGTKLLTSQNASKEVHVGDWVKITSGEHSGKHGYIVKSNKHERADPNDKAFIVDISDSKEKELVKVPFADVKMVTKYHDNENFGTVAAKGKAQSEKESAKADVRSFTASDGTSYAMETASTKPNLSWDASKNPLVLKRERTDAEVKKSAEYVDYLRGLMDEYRKAYKEREASLPKTAATTLKNSETIFKAVEYWDKAVIEFNDLVRELNDASAKDDEAKFGAALSKLKSLVLRTNEHSRLVKSKLSIQKFLSAARTTMAQGMEYMMYVRDNAIKYHKRMGMSQAQRDAADKTSVNMKQRWFE